MKCLIAAEGKVSEVIKANLEKCGLFPEWDFEAFSGDIFSYPHIDVDVLILSRFLCSEKANSFLSRVASKFAMSQIILLVGERSEQQKAFIAAAQEIGFGSIVTGKLPGDRPNTIFNAMKKAAEECSEGLVWEDEDEDELVQTEPLQDTQNVTETDTVDCNTADSQQSVNEDMPQSNNTSEVVPLRKVIEETIATGDKEAIRTKLEEVLLILGGAEIESPAGSDDRMERTGPGHQAVFVLSAANKGGVGKTTVAVTLSVALARAGVPTCIVDYDLGSPNVARWLGFDKGPGLEAIAGKPVRPNLLRDIIVSRHGVDILPGPMDSTMPQFLPGQLLEIIQVLKQMYPVVVCDTPPEYWTKPWLHEIFMCADYVLAVVDQSVMSEHDTMSYAPYLLSFGVTPDRIGIVLNRFSPKLHSVKKVEKIFCQGFKKEVKNTPKVKAVIPEDWNAYVQSGYKGEVAGLEDIHSQWHTLAAEIASMAGYEYSQNHRSIKRGLFPKSKDFGDRKSEKKGFLPKPKK